MFLSCLRPGAQNHSPENEFNLHVNKVSFSYERIGASPPRLALRNRLKVIPKWSIGFG